MGRKIHKERVENKFSANASFDWKKVDNDLKAKLKEKLSELNKEQGLDYIFTFGKYKNRVCRGVCEEDPGYIHWCVRNKALKFSKEVLDYVSKCDEENVRRARQRHEEFIRKQRERAEQQRKERKRREQNRQNAEDFFRKFMFNNTNIAQQEIKIVSPAAKWDHLPNKQKYAKIIGIQGGQITKQAIRDLVKKRMLEYHPDKCSNLGEELQKLAHEMTVRINDAYKYFKENYGI